ncbi:MAG TPA: HDOD domain-containing protein, partial [Bryobacteraceae bacterium]|nr:HDOD domain-containing protein [Bryobacteraceae bacterium]
MPVLSVTHGPRDELLRNLDKLPKLSPMVVQLLGIVAQPDCEVADLVKVVEKDAVLTAQVMQKANSAAFSRRQTIRTVQHAVALVGMGTMRRFALGSSMSNLFTRQKTARGFSTRRFNLHATATATLAEFLADALPVESKTTAFVAGLLHDIGELLIATTLPKAYETVLELVAASGDGQIACERRVLGTDHAELSAMAIAKWELDAAVEFAARYHAEPEQAPDVRQVRLDRVPLTLMIHRADLYVDS